MTDFPVLDADRAVEDAELGRVVIDDGGSAIEPHVAEMDSWVTMPLRIVHNAAVGIALEIGPYTLDHTDIRRLRDAIDRFYILGGDAS